MKEFGLTGGIGSGKSTVAQLLVERGAVLIDDDAIVRELQRPGELVFEEMVARWGEQIVRDDGQLDRAAVAEIVFNDPDELAALNHIVHPAVALEAARRRAELAGTDRLVVRDIPLLVRPGGEVAPVPGLEGFAGVIVVDTPADVAIRRVVEQRGLDRADVEARVSAQATSEERRAAADFVIDNSGDLDALHREIERCWIWMTERAPMGTT